MTTTHHQRVVHGQHNIMCLLFVLLVLFLHTVDAFTNFYDVLGVAPTASASEIRSAYKAAARANHPDIAGTSAVNTDHMTRLNEAKTVLLDAEKREQFDAMMKRVSRFGSDVSSAAAFPEFVLIYLACPEYLRLKTGMSQSSAYCACTTGFYLHGPVLVLIFILCEWIRWGGKDEYKSLIPHPTAEQTVLASLRITSVLIATMWLCTFFLYVETLWVWMIVIGVFGYALVKGVSGRPGFGAFVRRVTPAPVVRGDLHLRPAVAARLDREARQDVVRKEKKLEAQRAKLAAEKEEQRKWSESIEKAADVAPPPSDVVLPPPPAHVLAAEQLKAVKPSAAAGQQPSNVWSQGDQNAFEKALRKYPNGTAQRWEKVSEHMLASTNGSAHKSATQCSERYKYLCNLRPKK
eukprot:PhM_4_TR15336/c0_g1_i1/m.28623